MMLIVIMHPTNDLGGLDLNLIVALDALLAEKHVTRAASRLGITQSAASHALKRLRELLGDPLLVRGPSGAMLPTARGERLAPAIHAALGSLALALREPEFDPPTTKRTFHIGSADYAELVLVPKLVERLEKVAPNIDIWFHTYPGEGDDEIVSGKLDLLICPPRGHLRPAGCFEKLMFDETFTCVIRKGHPLARGKLTLDRYCEASHVMVAPRGTPGSFIDTELAILGKSRRVAVAVPHFLVVPHLLVTTDLVATLADRLVTAIGDSIELVRRPLPMDVTGFSIAMVWHERAHHDPAHRWLRDELMAVMSATARRYTGHAPR